MYRLFGSSSRAGKAEAVELGLERSRRGPGRRVFAGRGIGADDARHTAELGPRLEGGEQLAHRLLALTAHDGVEVDKEGLRFTGR